MSGETLRSAADKRVVYQGNYVLAAIDVAITGNRFSDEILKISVFCKGNPEYVQYIMPSKELSSTVQKLYNLNVQTKDGQRYLMSTCSQKILETVTEKVALSNLLDWMVSLVQKSDSAIGAFIFYQSNRQKLPYQLIHGINRCHLMQGYIHNNINFVDSILLEYGLPDVRGNTVWEMTAQISMSALISNEGIRNVLSLLSLVIPFTGFKNLKSLVRCKLLRLGAILCSCGVNVDNMASIGLYDGKFSTISNRELNIYDEIGNIHHRKLLQLFLAQSLKY